MQTLSVLFRAYSLLYSSTNAEFARVANAYAALKEKPDRNVVFIRVPIDIAPNVFSFHSINSAPSITFLSSTDVLGKKVVIPSIF